MIPSKPPSYTSEAIDGIQRLIGSNAFRDLSVQQQYKSYLVSSMNAAEAKQNDADRLELFKAVMDGYLSNSQWKISGTIYSVFNSGSASFGPSNAWAQDNVLWAWALANPYGGSRTYFATSGLQVL